jgi:hypothetical protein
MGTMLLNVAEGSGGLGVVVRVPGLVKPPSLVSSAVEALLLLPVEMQDMPRLDTDLSALSSTGELVLDECNALVRRDCWRSYRGGVAFEKEALKDSCSFKAEGRGVGFESGGSSTSARMSSSADRAEAVLGGTIETDRLSGIPTWLRSFGVMALGPVARDSATRV